MSEERFSIPVLTGTVAGVLAWVVGYLVTYLVTVDEVRSDVRVFAIQEYTGQTIDWQAVGWLFYNAHTVDTQVPRIGIFSPGYENFLAASDGNIWLLYFLPPVTLLLAGALATARERDGVRTLLDAAIAGTTVAVGYLLVCVLGLFVFAVDVGNGTIRPDSVPAVLLAGFLYPLVFSGLGGLLVGVLLERYD